MKSRRRKPPIEEPSTDPSERGSAPGTSESLDPTRTEAAKPQPSPERACSMIIDNNPFGDPSQSSIASNYDRLCNSMRIKRIGEILERRGMTARGYELLLRSVAMIPGHWKESNETWKQAEARRSRLAGKLRRLARELRDDREANLISFSAELAAYTGIRQEPGVMLTFADLMDIEASFLEGSDTPHCQTLDGKILTAREYDRSVRPQRSIPLRSYAVKAIFDLLQPHFKRAPNKETEIFASVLLQEKVGPGTVSHMRKADRRHYVKEK